MISLTVSALVRCSTPGMLINFSKTGCPPPYNIYNTTYPILGRIIQAWHGIWKCLLNSDHGSKKSLGVPSKINVKEEDTIDLERYVKERLTSVLVRATIVVMKYPDHPWRKKDLLHFHFTVLPSLKEVRTGNKQQEPGRRS